MFTPVLSIKKKNDVLNTKMKLQDI